MDTFDDILKYHKDLLINKGYDDPSLNAFGGIEPFMSRLEQNIAYSIARDGSVLCPEGFTVPIKGFFRGDKDIVDYRFGYSFDYHRVPQLRFVTATMAGERITIPLEASDHLPHASYLYDILQIDHLLSRNIDSKLEEKIQLIIPYVRTNIDALCERQGNIFSEKGFFSKGYTAVFKRDQFTEELRNQVLKNAVTSPHYLGLFVINTPKPDPNDRYTMSLRMVFDFYMPNTRLNIVALQAKIGEEKVLVFPRKTYLLPDAEKIYHHLSMQNSIKNARKVYSKVSASLTNGMSKGHIP